VKSGWETNGIVKKKSDNFVSLNFRDTFETSCPFHNFVLMMRLFEMKNMKSRASYIEEDC